MPRTFIALTQDEQDDFIAQHILARERELFHYDLNVQILNDQIGQGGHSAADMAALQKRLADEQRERGKSEKTYAALLSALPSGTKRDAALSRVRVKEAARDAAQK